MKRYRGFHLSYSGLSKLDWSLIKCRRWAILYMKVLSPSPPPSMPKQNNWETEIVVLLSRGHCKYNIHPIRLSNKLGQQDHLIKLTFYVTKVRNFRLIYKIIIYKRWCTVSKELNLLMSRKFEGVFVDSVFI